MRFLLLTLFGCLTFAAGRAQQPAKIEGAHLHMEVASHDFGDVPRKGGDLVREFTFTNDGTVPLVVTRVISSCSCLKASYSKRPVAPGESGTISIIYEPRNRRKIQQSRIGKTGRIQKLSMVAQTYDLAINRKESKYYNK